MSVVSEIIQAADDIFTELGDLVKQVQFHAVDVNTYDTNTGTIARTEVTDSPFTVDAVEYNIVEKDVPVALGQADTLTDTHLITSTFIIQQADLSVTPKEDDFITSLFITYQINDIKQDPAGAVWIIDVEVVL